MKTTQSGTIDAMNFLNEPRPTNIHRATLIVKYMESINAGFWAAMEYLESDLDMMLTRYKVND